MKYTNYFEVEKKMSFFYDFAFMSKAIFKDSKCTYSHVLCSIVDGEITMIETDIRRMHILTIEKSIADFLGIIPGTWDCVFKSATKVAFAKINTAEIDIGDFPPWEIALPKGEIVKTLEKIEFPNFNKNNPSNMKTDLNKFFHCLDERFGMNLFYLSDLRPFSWTVKFRENSANGNVSAVDFLSDNKRAVIMPMNCGWN